MIMPMEESQSHLAERERKTLVQWIVNLEQKLNETRVRTRASGDPAEMLDEVLVTVHMLEDKLMELDGRLAAIEKPNAPSTTKGANQLERFRDLMRDSDWMTAAELAFAFDCTVNTVWRLLSKMKGTVEKRVHDGTAAYRLQSPPN